MNCLQIYKSREFGEIRTYAEPNGAITFCGADVARALGYSEPQKAVRDHCKEDGCMFRTVTDSMNRKQQAKFISEGNLYRLIAGSHLPDAEKFESWIFDEIIPTIRKHGAYMTSEAIEKILSDPDTIIRLATDLKNGREQRRSLESKIEQDKPKVVFADAVSVSESPMLIGELAKVLKQNGVEIGEKRLFEWMRKRGYLISRFGTDYNAPTQKSMELGLFRVKETAITHADGHVTVSRTTKVTGKGQQYFINKFLGVKENAS